MFFYPFGNEGTKKRSHPTTSSQREAEGSGEEYAGLPALRPPTRATAAQARATAGRAESGQYTGQVLTLETATRSKPLAFSQSLLQVGTELRLRNSIGGRVV